jgi:cysteine desulfurase
MDAARETIASVLNCQPGEIVFTSCSSEADNLALRGATLTGRENRKTRWILTSRTEHPAFSKTAEDLERRYGFQVEWLEENVRW